MGVDTYITTMTISIRSLKPAPFLVVRLIVSGELEERNLLLTHFYQDNQTSLMYICTYIVHIYMYIYFLAQAIAFSYEFKKKYFKGKNEVFKNCSPYSYKDLYLVHFFYSHTFCHTDRRHSCTGSYTDTQNTRGSRFHYSSHHKYQPSGHSKSNANHLLAVQTSSMWVRLWIRRSITGYILPNTLSIYHLHRNWHSIW